MKLTVLTLSLLAMGATAMCPGTDKPCSGHGECGKNDKCSCSRNWMGNGCAERVCPFRHSWAGFESGDGAGGQPLIEHSYLECSGKGKCDRATGQCTCFPGFGGKGCTRMDCPNGCNGHGTCEYLDEINTNIDTWDAHKIQQCKCDPGYAGYDCSEKLCRTGDDPLTESGADPEEVQELDFDTNAVTAGDFTLTYTDWRGAKWTTWAIDIDGLTPLAIKEALIALPNQAIPDVEVVQPDPNTEKYEVHFDEVTNPGAQELLVVDGTACSASGCMPEMAGHTGTVVVTRTASASTLENEPCSNRGTCDTTTGICACEGGYYGEACQLQTIIR